MFVELMMRILDRLRRSFTRKKKPSLRERYPQYEIGRHSYGDLRVHHWGENATLKVGAFCSIAGGVRIFLGGEHRVDWVTTFPFSTLWELGDHEYPGHPHTKGDVIIGNDVWIGNEALIMSGVRVGDGAVIGARAVVTRDVPPYAIVVGNPARIVRLRFAQEQIDRLLALSWWAWEDEKIRTHLPLMLDTDIARFLDAAEQTVAGSNC